MATDDTLDYDIIIAGGGMIGTSLAVALAPLAFKVAVIEPVARDLRMQPSFDDRSTALSRSSQRMFQAMGLWPEIAAAGTPIRSIHVSEKGRFGFSHIDAAQQRVEALGYVVINRVLGKVLNDALLRLATVDLMCPASIVGVEHLENAIVAVADTAAGRQSLSCRLLVAADGARSSVREMMGIGASNVDYQQLAVIGNVLPEIDPDSRAFERFTGTGPIAMLPVADRRAAFVWVLSPKRANEVMQLGDSAFTEALQEAFGQRLGTLSRVGERAAFPLALSRANALTTRRGVLVGNASHGLHPIAAQGFNLGMRDVAALCDCLLDACGAESTGERDPGAASILEAYADWRRSDQAKTVRFTDGLVRLFDDSRPPLRFLRNIGMLGFDLFPGVRSVFARHTMGLAGQLPRLSRGVPLK
jgi:2-octaprenyl-6-methoxyphenol hydroxylase